MNWWLLMGSIFLSETAPPQLFTQGDATAYVVGPGEITSASPLTIAHGHVWVKTNQKEYSLSLGRYPPLTLHPHSYLGCSVQFESQTCTVFEGLAQWNGRDIDEGMELDLVRGKTKSIKILTAIESKENGYQASWSTETDVPSNFMVSVGHNPNLLNPELQRITRNHFLHLPFKEFKPLFLQITAFRKRSRRRVRSPVMPLVFHQPVIQLTPPPQKLVIHRRSRPMTLSCALFPGSKLNIQLVKGTDTVTFEKKSSGCPIELPSLTEGYYKLKIQTVDKNQPKAFFQYDISIVHHPLPRYLELQTTETALVWTALQEDLFYEIELLHKGKQHFITKWSTSLELPSEIKGSFQARLRAGLPTRPPVYSKWSPWVKR